MARMFALHLRQHLPHKELGLFHSVKERPHIQIPAECEHQLINRELDVLAEPIFLHVEGLIFNIFIKTWGEILFTTRYFFLPQRYKEKNQHYSETENNRLHHVKIILALLRITVEPEDDAIYCTFPILKSDVGLRI